MLMKMRVLLVGFLNVKNELLAAEPQSHRSESGMHSPINLCFLIHRQSPQLEL